MSVALVILAAGKGTRMESDLPKVLHPIAQVPMLLHAMRAGATLEPEKVVVVAGYGAELVSKAAASENEDSEIVLQTEQLGTAHAVDQARELLAEFSGDVVVLYGDTPFVTSETLAAMIKARAEHDLVVLGFQAQDPARYGRLVTHGNELLRIVEYTDATPEEREITLCNSGLIACDAKTLFELIAAVSNENASGEYYLTDIVALARQRDLSATVVTCDESETLGVNSRAGLAAADGIFQTRAREQLLSQGVTLMAPETVYLSQDTVIGRDTVIEPNVVFGPDVTVESGAFIRAFSHLEGCHVSKGAIVGPFARLRPGAELAENTKVGNFVEIKNSKLDSGAKVNHLSYVGDADIGANANVGAGTVTCNYDGVMKHRTSIGSGTFIGSNTLLVAPVTVGQDAMTATGTVITRNVDDGALAIGRVKQENKPGRARKLFDMLRAKKAMRDKEIG